MKFVIFSLILATLMTGCLKTRNEVRDSEQRNVMQQQVVNLQKTNADVGGRFSDLEEQMRNLNGRLEVVENRTERMSVGTEGIIKNSQQQAQDLNQKLALFQEALAKQERDIQSLSVEIQSLKTQHVSEAPAKAAKSSKNYLESAEDHFDKKEWKQAILNFQKYRDESPKGAKFAEATYKIGVSFQELGMKEEAKTFFEEVVAKASKSDAARKAKVRLKNLK
jgi:TolA-binding protein